MFERVARAVREQRIRAPRQVRRIDHFLDRCADRLRQVLPAVLLGCDEAVPAARHVLVVGLLETLRRFHARAGFVVAAPFLVAHGVERSEHLFGELRGLVEHGVDDVARGRFAARQARVLLLHAEHIEHREAHVGERRGVFAHDGSTCGEGAKINGIGSECRARATAGSCARICSLCLPRGC